MTQLLIVLLVLAIVTIIGHWIWVVLALLVRALVGPGQPVAAEKTVRCGHCGGFTKASEVRCQLCGREWRDPAADELNDLAAVERQLQRFRTGGTLNEQVAQRFLSQLQAYRRRLENAREASAAGTAGAAPADRELQQLLRGSPHTSPQARRRALELYDRLEAAARAELSPWLQFELARLLALSGRVEQAIETYWRLVVNNPDHPGCARTAMEGARLALRAKRLREARQFLDATRGRHMPPDLQRETLRLMQALEGQSAAVESPIIPSAGLPVATRSPQPAGDQALPAEPIAEAIVVTAPAAPGTPPDAEVPGSGVPGNVPAAPSGLGSVEPAYVQPSDVPAAPRRPPKPPRRSLADVLSTFMEERNIRWGELVGGLLIVCSSIALVISLWDRLQTIPYVQFFIFVGVTAALFGVGLYTDHRWKLEATSRGVLIISTLLVPLNFAAMAGTAQARWDVVAVLAQLASLGIFVALVVQAARVLAPTLHWWLALAVVGNSGLLLAIPREVSPWSFYLLAGLPVVCYGLPVGRAASALRGRTDLDAREAHRLLIFLGTATFALLVALGLLIVRSTDRSLALDRLAPLVSLAAVPVAACGLLVMRGMAARQELEGLRTAGIAIALIGLGAMLAAAGLAWPQPAEVILVGALNFAVITAIAFRFRLPVAHGVAIACLTLAYVTAFHWLRGNLDLRVAVAPGAEVGRTLLRLAASAQTGTALSGLFVLLASAAEVIARRGRRQDAAFYAGMGGVVALGSLLLVTVDGFTKGSTDAVRAMLLYGLYGAGTLALNARWQRPIVSKAGLVLIACATFWGLWWWHDRQFAPVWATVMSVEALVFAGLAGVLGHVRFRLSAPTRPGDSPQTEPEPNRVLPLIEAYRQPLAACAEALALVAIALGVWAGARLALSMAEPWQPVHVATGAGLTAAFLLLAAQQQRRALAWLAGAMLTGTLVAATGWLPTTWFAAGEAPELAPLMGLSVALGGALMAAVAVWSAWAISRASARAAAQSPLRGAWYGVFAVTWLETAAASCVLAFCLTIFSGALTVSALPAYTAAAVAATLFALAWGSRQAPLSWAASAFVLAALVHELAVQDRPWLEYPWAAAVLSHATLMLLGSLALRPAWRSAVRADPDALSPEPRLKQRLGQHLHTVFVGPLGQSGFLGSAAALPLVLWFGWHQPLAIALYLLWLSALWLIVALTEGSPPLFSAFQSVLTLSAGFAITAWLRQQAWITQEPLGLMHPVCLQAYGIGLGLMSLFWMALRLVVRGRSTTGGLINPHWPAVDRLVHFGLVAGCAALAVWGVSPGIEQELYRGSPTAAMTASAHAHAYGAAAWLLLAILAASLVAALWHDWGRAELLAAIVLAATVAVLAAGPFGVSQATASALRWSLALAFAGYSSLVWFREPLFNWFKALGCRIESGSSGPVLAQAALIASTVAPALWLTLEVAALGFSGQPPAMPAAASWFARIGPTASTIGPLVLITVTFVAYAIRELSPGYALAAGLVANVSVAGGYALGVVTGGGRLGTAESVRLLQLSTILAAIYAIAWLACRPMVLARHKQPPSPRANLLVGLQVAQGAMGNVLLLLPAFVLLAVAWDTTLDWTAEAGSPLGWIALVLASAAAGLRAWQARSRLRPEVVGLLGMSALGLVAASIERTMPGTPWSYRALMLGWALYALSVVAATWWAATFYAPAGSVEPPPALLRTAAIWVRLAGILSVLLGLKAAALHSDDRLWAAGAIALASAAGAAMAVWRRREGWALTAGLGVNLAASLVVWERQLRAGATWEDWWMLLVQANMIASAVVALLWLAARRRLYAGRPLRLASSPLLGLQVAIALAGNALLMGLPLAELILDPGRITASMIRQGQPEAWFAWTLTMIAAGVYSFEITSRRIIDVLSLFVLGLGVLVSCCAVSRWPEPWLAYHMLLAAWTATGLALLAVAWLGPYLYTERLRELWRDRGGWSLTSILNPKLVEAWIGTIQVLVAGLAIRGAWHDPARPYWSAGAALAAGLMGGGMALWLNKPAYAYNSGLLVNVAASIVWLAGRPQASAIDLLSINTLALALSASIWSVVSQLSGGASGAALAAEGTGVAVMRAMRELERIPFAHVAAQGAVLLLGVSVACVLGGDVLRQPIWFNAALAWASWAATLGAGAISLWDARVRFCLPCLYAVGLSGVALALAQARLPAAELARLAALALGAYVLLASLMAWGGGRASSVRAALRIPLGNGRFALGWFPPAQGILACLVVVLSVWTSIDADRLAWRLTGCAAAALILPAGVLLAHRAPATSAAWRYATLGLCTILLAEVGWAWLEPGEALRWLHRSVALMSAAALMATLCGPGLSRLLPRTGRLAEAWVEAGRRSVPIVGGLALTLLVLVLVQEGMHYQPRLGVPMAMVAKAGVASVLAGLAALALAFAVRADLDPLRLSLRGRMGYVYAAEALAALITVHTRLTVPRLFELPIMDRYWTLIVMAVAFAGAGLSEFFERRGLSVLSQPLARTALLAPLLPVIGYWTPLNATLISGKLVFVLVALFYGLLAVTKRSFVFAAFAAAAANTALWVLLFHRQVFFSEHPQLWLIPPALAALVAEHLNRSRLNAYQSGALRYLALAVIYVSSTADVFISYVGTALSVRLVLVLMVLSVAGVLAGIMLRVRSFLYLGMAFLLVDLSIMIYHAAVDLDQTWVFWLSCLLLGVAIIALFAVFEKRRNDVLVALERFKEWS